MLTKRPTSFLLTPQYRVDALCVEWHRSRGQGRSASSRSRPRGAPRDLHRLARARRSTAQTRSENYTLLAGGCLADRSVAQLDLENAEICAIRSTTSRTHTGAVSIPQRMEAEAAQSRSVTNAEPPAATPILKFCDLTSGRRRKQALAGEPASP